MIIGGKVITNEADIDKSKVVISRHAIERFIQRMKENRQPLPESYGQAKEMLTKFFLNSWHKNTVDPVRRVKSLIDHGESFFFRYGNWLFPVAEIGNKNIKQLIVMTAIWDRQSRSR